MTLKLKLMSLLAFAAFAVTSCEKDPIDDPFCRNPKTQKPGFECGTGNGETGGGESGNGILPGGCVRYQANASVEFLPLQCQGGDSKVPGVLIEGKYYMVRCDKSGKFAGLKPGDAIHIEYWFSDDCVFAAACSEPWADGCICIEVLDDDPTR